MDKSIDLNGKYQCSNEDPIPVSASPRSSTRKSNNIDDNNILNYYNISDLKLFQKYGLKFNHRNILQLSSNHVDFEKLKFFLENGININKTKFDNYNLNFSILNRLLIGNHYNSLKYCVDKCSDDLVFYKFLTKTYTILYKNEYIILNKRHSIRIKILEKIIIPEIVEIIESYLHMSEEKAIANNKLNWYYCNGNFI